MLLLGAPRRASAAGGLSPDYLVWTVSQLEPAAVRSDVDYRFLVSADTDGDARADFALTVEGLKNLGADDFFL